MKRGYRASVFHCLDDPGEHGEASGYETFEDGLLLVDEGRISAVGNYADLSDGIGDVDVEDLRGHIIVPGLIDCHVHFPQLDIIASYGERLLDWLERYAYPAEMRYADGDYARAAAEFFLDEMIANGTTSAAVFATVHKVSADALFEAADRRGMRLIAGKVLMDTDVPESLADDPESGYADSRDLIERWHGKGRLAYAITPRFALLSSEAQLEAAGRLAAEFPDTWVHTHLAENHDEIDAVHRRFPWCDTYLGVYDRFGLLRRRSLFAHCLHLEDDDRARMAEKGGAAAFCPTSNLFLGSGLFDLRAMHEAEVPVGIATDVGGGTSLSMLRTMSAAYKVLALNHQTLPASRALYLATLGAARALELDDHIGNLEPGKEADFVVLNPDATPITAHRSGKSLEETLFTLMMIGDDRHVSATAIAGQLHRSATR